ncbi:hypothetical protein LZK73_24485 (plasmid) [Neorhizobium galegae]|nr:hypothetical protein LZK73_24485 [Neorhizobium galegae]
MPEPSGACFLLRFVAAHGDQQRGGPAATKRNNRAAGNAGSCEGVRLYFCFVERLRLRRASQFEQGAHVLPAASGLSTIHSQITGIILLGLTIIVLGGSFLEQRVGNGYSMVDVEELADSVFTIASILKTATPEERDIVLRAANRAGWDLNLRPRALAETFKNLHRRRKVSWTRR